MRSILAFVLAALLWFAVAPTASAQESGLLVPCSESPEFQAREFRNTTADPESGQKRAERYGQALCGEDGLPHLIVDGRLDRAGDFIIPGLMFLYIAGWIGWVGRSYLIAVRSEKNPEMKEIVIDVPLAFNKMIGGFTWPVAAVQEFLSGELTAADNDIPVSPR
ncbi:MAG: Photosystem I reaction center subunit III [Cyanobacteria bacterium J06641_5]